MRTNIVIDDELIHQAMALSGAATKREAVHQALAELVRNRRRLNVLDHAGIGWDGSLDEMRTDLPA